MTQVFFYHNATDRLNAVAALIGKAAQQKKALLVYAPDPQIADAIDRQLWVQHPTGFVPHVRAQSPLASETLVVIADTLEHASQSQRLFNLSREIPPGFSRFASLIEVVGQDDEDRLAGRERVKFYKDRGYEIQFIDLEEKQR
ncbi:DNA polymerase III subunit chi [Propionivibrio dicarboxylicus]|uniref:DNA polymerase III, chi subunit n=1 Tax=Propionivibrio dicarboxylicus TaxID=83767 RepID=A0A1G7ZTP9_9RHOO|nr:DNA polymerase III subunit chi [Propionivibrio dicarboxylicus]SDH11886.1 DNA polymerase III, chi subunit [Propionivibrio dicarboxylicus]